jgi:hypothetical protein
VTAFWVKPIKVALLMGSAGTNVRDILKERSASVIDAYGLMWCVLGKHVRGL